MLKHPSIRFGLLSGALLCLVFFTPYFLWGSRFDLQLGEALGYAAILLSMAVGVFPAIRIRRERDMGGKISFGQAFRTGLLSSLISALCVCMAVYLFWERNGTDWLDRNYAAKKEKIQERFLGDSLLIQQKLEDLEQKMETNRHNHQNSSSQAGTMFIIVLLFGGILSVSAATVQRKQ